MIALLLIVSVLACAAMLADAPVVAALVLWIGLAGFIALVFGAAALIGRHPGEEDSRAP